MQRIKTIYIYLNLVHERCVAEETVADESTSDPLLRLVHGLPGAGCGARNRSRLWDMAYGLQVCSDEVVG